MKSPGSSVRHVCLEKTQFGELLSCCWSADFVCLRFGGWWNHHHYHQQQPSASVILSDEAVGITIPSSQLSINIKDAQPEFGNELKDWIRDQELPQYLILFSMKSYLYHNFQTIFFLSLNLQVMKACLRISSSSSQTSLCFCWMEAQIYPRILSGINGWNFLQRSLT